MLDHKQTEALRELAVQQGLHIEQTQYGDMFVTHHHHIFFKWHPKHNQWFFIVHRTGEDATTGYTTLGGDWFTSWSSWIEGITWGQQTSDQDITFWDRLATRSQGKRSLLLDVASQTDLFLVA